MHTDDVKYNESIDKWNNDGTLDDNQSSVGSGISKERRFLIKDGDLKSFRRQLYFTKNKNT